MDTLTIEEIYLAGISLPFKTTNENGQSVTDCGSLWQKFEKEDCVSQIPGKLDGSVYAVYHEYEGDHTKPFSYFIGCRVEPAITLPDGMVTLRIPAGNYKKITARGKMPDCIAGAWKEIWNSSLQRKFTTDFEVYDERSKDWQDAEVDIYLSVI